MSTLVLDIGNTKIGAAELVENDIVRRFIGAHARDVAPESRAAECFDWCTEVVTESDEGVERVVVASVVPSMLELWSHLWSGKPATWDIPLVVVRHTLPLPFEVAVERPESVGADRYCDVAGAVALGYPNAIIADLGTANTFDVLRKGVFLGGLIGPGGERAHHALVESGAQLPDLPFDYPPGLIGGTTEDAMLAGSFYSAVGSAAYILQRLGDEYPGSQILITGGLAEMIGPELGATVLYQPDLTLIGAARIGEEVALRS